MKRRKIKLKYVFVRFRNGRLNYRCKECKKPYTKLTNHTVKNFPILHKFCNGDLNKFFSINVLCWRYG